MTPADRRERRVLLKAARAERSRYPIDDGNWQAGYGWWLHAWVFWPRDVDDFSKAAVQMAESAAFAWSNGPRRRP